MNERMFSILIVDDEPDYRETLSLLLDIGRRRPALRRKR